MYILCPSNNNNSRLLLLKREGKQKIVISQDKEEEETVQTIFCITPAVLLLRVGGMFPPTLKRLAARNCCLKVVWNKQAANEPVPHKPSAAQEHRQRVG